MSFNQGSLSYTQADVVGPGGAGAYNGVSVDFTNQVVLGNDTGSTDAILINDREIPMDGFFLRLLQLFATNPTLILSAGNINAQTMLANEGTLTTKFQILQTDAEEFLSEYDQNFWHFIGNAPIE